MQPAYEVEALEGDVYTHFFLQCAEAAVPAFAFGDQALNVLFRDTEIHAELDVVAPLKWRARDPADLQDSQFPEPHVQRHAIADMPAQYAERPRGAG